MPKALEGIRVIDFSWVFAGPALTRCLGDYGAEVIKVESSVHPDLIRTSPPYKDGKAGLNRSAYWANINCNKYGVTLNLQHPKGIEVARRLIAGADIVVENFKPGTMVEWGLGYEDLVKVNPDIIMVSISLFGQEGPYQHRFGFGAFAEGMTGISNLFGWPDRGPSYFQQFVGDALVPFFGVSAVMSALEHRDRTGQGQRIDLNQLNVCAYLMAPLLLDSAVNGREVPRCGNAAPGVSPHAVYPCAGEDRWCAISVSSDEEWHNLCLAMGDPHWCHDARFATFAGRKANEAELDKLMGAWTVRFSPDELMNLLQEKGVAAGAVLTGKGMYNDPQLKHREAVWYMEHPGMGRLGYYAGAFKLSSTPSGPRLAPPRLGEHTEYVCTEILKMSREEYAELSKLGVFV